VTAAGLVQFANSISCAENISGNLGGDMWRILAIVLVLGLAACQKEDAPLASGLDGYDPYGVETQRAECTERGGRFGQGGLTGTFVCYEITPDANKSCSAASDCDGVCLARSRTCSPVKPLTGCQDVLSNSGRMTTVCIN